MAMEGATRMTQTLTLTDAHAQAEAASQAADERLPALRARRQALALDALTNRQAERELSTVEEQITTLERDRDRANLVVAEVRAREAAAAEAAAKAERERELARLAALQQRVNEQFAAVDAALATLCTALEGTLATYREVYSVAQQLEVAEQRGIRWNMRERLARRLLTRLRPLLGPAIGDHVRPEHRETSLATTPTNTEDNNADPDA
jgi:DNA repair exonuclease SbcCD ATPase subunit